MRILSATVVRPRALAWLSALAAIARVARVAGVAGIAGIAGVGSGAAHAQSWHEIELVPDGFVELAGEIATPSAALRELGSGITAGVTALYPPLPAEVGLAAFERRSDGALVIATAVPWLSPQGVLCANDRLCLVDPVPLEPPLFGPVEVRARIDAVAHFGGPRYLVSFDSALLDSDDILVEDEDLAFLDLSIPSFQLVFDASTFGVPPELDLDAVAWFPESTQLLVSFDLPALLGGQLVRPSDVAHIAVDFAQWSIVYAGTARFAAWANRDVVALDATAPGVSAGLFIDGVDNGSTTRWSSVVP